MSWYTDHAPFRVNERRSHDNDHPRGYLLVDRHKRVHASDHTPERLERIRDRWNEWAAYDVMKGD